MTQPLLFRRPDAVSPLATDWQRLLRIAQWRQVLTFTIDAEAFGWQKHASVQRGRHRFEIPTKENEEWRRLVRASLAPNWRTAPIAAGTPLAIITECVFTRPKHHHFGDDRARSLRTESPHWKTSKPDVDNIEKGILDSLSTVVWTDDAQIAASVTITRWCAPNERRRVLVTVYDLSECNLP